MIHYSQKKKKTNTWALAILTSRLHFEKQNRMLSTWISYDDLRSLIIACINCPNVQHSIIFGVSNKELADYINENLDYDQLILEYWKESDPNSGWVHCSYSQNHNRKQYLKAFKINGSTKYESMV